MIEKIPYTDIQKGTLMIATPEINTGIFFRGVVLICEHNPKGSFGIVINKPLEVELPEEILDVHSIANPRAHLRAGGPIQTNQMMLLHNSDKIAKQTLTICDGVFLGGDLQFLQDTISDPQGPSIYLCFGYVGWGGGQLEREFLDGGWFIHKATAKHIFETPGDKLWQTLLREMGGKYTTLSMIPEDLSWN